MSIEIHPTALVSPEAKIGDGSCVGPYSIIGPKVTLGTGTKVASHVVIEGHTIAGDGNEFFQFCSIGSRPQDLKYKGEDSVVEIGDRNTIREYVTIQPGTSGGGMRTVIGNGNLLMGSVHIGHDSIVGNSNILANGVAVAGHVKIGNGVTIGGLSGIHQFVQLGDLAFIAAGAMVTQDIPPFCMAQGDRAALVGLNRIGMQRKGLDTNVISEIKRLYRELFVADGPFRQKIEKLTASVESEASKTFLSFITNSQRGVAHARGGSDPD
jgi:UDP-N-acetylglucosamine acyltransferase